MTQCGRHGVSLILQAGCHGTAVDQFGGGTEKAPALSLVTHCQALDAQGESQADEFIRQGFNLICAVYTFEQYMVKRNWRFFYFFFWGGGGGAIFGLYWVALVWSVVTSLFVFPSLPDWFDGGEVCRVCSTHIINLFVL